MQSYSAFPVVAPDHGPIMTGLSKHEYAAIQILSAMVSGYDSQSKVNGIFIPANDYDELAKSAIQLSATLLKNLEVQ